MTTSFQTTPGATKGTNSRRRSFFGAAGLVAKSLTEAIDLPGLREPIRTAQDIATALKPHVLQAPKNNNVKAQELIDRIEDILAQIKRPAGAIEYESEELHKYNPGLHMIIRKLEGIKAELFEMKSKNYPTRLACQQEIEQLLSKKEYEVHTAIQDLCVSQMYLRPISKKLTDNYMHVDS
ncbi:unnamed protein product [Rhizoctonia solani]|uniref:Uncharacterized protein n=1 Tax=Rhizoctonia solani TaxID=456999 RepID=A0A8H3E648_9AGAM|nr:unnamed protein product [Rhizoctonia solani]